MKATVRQSSIPSVEKLFDKIESSPSLSGYINHFSDMLHGANFSDKHATDLPKEAAIPRLLLELDRVRQQDGTIYLIGNGGSAAVASHIANDFCNTSAMRAITLHDPSILTCFTNDYGYARAYAMLVERMARPGDVLIAISSSGQSSNILAAAQSMHNLGGTVITLSGFAADNPLRVAGDMNIWVDSKAYGMVEVGHLLLLHYLADQLSKMVAQTR